MCPILFELPLPFVDKGVPIHGYGLAIVIGFLLATFVAAREARRRGLPDFVFDLGLVMLFCGLFGGRIVYYLREYGDKFAHRSPLAFFAIWEGGLVFYGGAILGFLGGLAYLRRRRLPIASCLDVASIGVPIGMAFGRLGCFLNGCCFGKLCSLDAPLGVTFPRDSNVHDHQTRLGWIEPSDASLAVHPVQLYQAAHDFLLVVLLWLFLRRPETPRGAGIPMLFVLYGVGRFFLEGLRGDQEPTWSGLTFSQNLSAGLFLVFGSVLIVLYYRALKKVAGNP